MAVNDNKQVVAVPIMAPNDTSHNIPIPVVILTGPGGSIAGGTGGGPATIADGANVVEGATADAAITADGTGTINAKIRGLIKILADIWDSTNHWLQVKVMNGSLSVPLRIDPVGTTAQPVSQSSTPWLTADQALTTGGLSIYSFLSTGAVQAAVIKNSAGQVYALHFFNNTGTICYVRLYNQTTSPGTGDTVIYRGLIPANTSGAGFVVPIPTGFTFNTGIGIRVTAAVADNDATVLTANQILGNVFYK